MRFRPSAISYRAVSASSFRRKSLKPGCGQRLSPVGHPCLLLPLISITCVGCSFGTRIAHQPCEGTMLIHKMRRLGITPALGKLNCELRQQKVAEDFAAA